MRIFCNDNAKMSLKDVANLSRRKAQMDFWLARLKIYLIQWVRPLRRWTPWRPEISLRPSRRGNCQAFWAGPQPLKEYEPLQRCHRGLVRHSRIWKYQRSMSSHPHARTPALA